MRFLYTLSIWSFGIIARFYSLINPKAKKWVQGRKNWKEKLKKDIGENQNLIWLHCSSLGEFEQGRPIIEGLVAKGEKILLTFFSPSGYENLKNYKYATVVSYLPLDSPSNAKEWMSIVKPKAAIFVKYEFWYNYMQALNKEDVPFFLISGIFRKSQYFFKWYGKWFAGKLKDFSHLFVQDSESLELLKSIGIEKVSVSGDTRFDRVLDIASNPKEVELVEKFTKDKFSIVAGSTWHEDEKILISLLNEEKDLVLVIAPHDIDHDRINELVKNSNGMASLYSEGQLSNERILIINEIGLLSSIYRYGKVAFIGGGFGSGIHNTLEAAVYGMPVIFGPNYKKFREAKDMIENSGALSVSNLNDLSMSISKLKDQNTLLQMGANNKQYIDSQKGGSKLILNRLKELSIY